MLILKLNAPKCFIFECFSRPIFCTILIDLQRWVFLHGCADICADKLAGQLGAGSETQSEAAVALKQN